MEGTLREFRYIQPSLIVAAGIAPTDLVHQNHVLHQHSSATDAILQGIIQAVFHRVHALLVNGCVENGLFAVLMHEDDAIIGGNHTVGMCRQALGGCKLIAGLETFALGELKFLGTPILVGYCHALLDSRTRYINVHHRFPDVSPQLYR